MQTSTLNNTVSAGHKDGWQPAGRLVCEIMIEFVIEERGKKYNCTRVITSGVFFTQEIHVFGVGSRVDPVQYGPNAFPIISMAAFAQLIAHQIVCDRLKETE